MKLREKFWLWGHPEGCYNNAYGNIGISRMTPMEAYDAAVAWMDAHGDEEV